LALTQAYQTKLAAVAAAQAALDDAQLNLAYTKIVSPLDGIAGQQEAQIGDLVGTGSNTVLTTVSQINPIWCYFPISEQNYWEFADRLKEMMMVPEDKRPEKVELILPNGSVYTHKGRGTCHLPVARLQCHGRREGRQAINGAAQRPVPFRDQLFHRP